MNWLQRCYCRVYQLAFRLAMPLLPYREPERFENIQALPELLNKLELTSVLLVTDRPLRQAGVTGPLEELLARSGVRCAVYDGTRANPTVQNVEEARELYLAEGCQGLIAFGGMDALNERLGIPKTLPEIKPEDVPAMARYAAREANPLYPVPRLMDAGELEALYGAVGEWRNEP